MQITLNWPPPELSPNARVHWAKRASKVKSYRSQCGWKARSQGLFPSDADEVAMTITFRPPDLRRRDRDNMIAAFKAGMDGISDAIGVDDSRFIPTYRVGDTYLGGAVIVEIGGDV